MILKEVNLCWFSNCDILMDVVGREGEEDGKAFVDKNIMWFPEVFG